MLVRFYKAEYGNDFEIKGYNLVCAYKEHNYDKFVNMLNLSLKDGNTLPIILEQDNFGCSIDSNCDISEVLEYEFSPSLNNESITCINVYCS